MIIGKYLQLIKGKYPSILNGILRAVPDPARVIFGEDITEEEYSDSVSYFRLGTTNKTTFKRRHVLSDQAILNNLELSRDKIFLDIGASDGITSLDMIKNLNHDFEHYFITDYNLHVGYKNVHGWHFFFDIKTRECILASNQYLFLRPLAIAKLKKLGVCKNIFSYRDIKVVTLVNPQIYNCDDYIQGKITILEYDIMQMWAGVRPNVIKIANVLNRVYFSDHDIKKALANSFKVLTERGLLALIHNIQKLETCTLIRKVDDYTIEIVKHINGGVEIHNLLSHLNFNLK